MSLKSAEVRGAAPHNCQLCQGSASTYQILHKFAEKDYGHYACRQCGISFDSDVNQVMDESFSKESISGITDEKEYRRLFVETSKIGDDKGDVYTDFSWADNTALKRGIADHIITSIRKYSAGTGPRMILDLGCGTGFTSVELSSAFPHATVFAVDPSPLVLRVNGVKNVKAFQGTIETIDLEKNKLDAVCIIGNWMLHTNPLMTMKLAADLLRPGGLLVIDFKNVNSMVRRIVKLAARLGLSSRLPKAQVEKSVLNMRFGYHKAFVRKMAETERLELLEAYSKPPRLLEFENKARVQSGIQGMVWRITDLADTFLDERAWVQITFRKR